MRGHILGHLFDARLAFEKILEIDGAIQNLIEFFDIGNAFRVRQREKFLSMTSAGTSISLGARL